ncbi:putative Zinc finger, RanBP2-type [Rosa chinensis]|uniref:Putative Zinc finger, RanBP2-type n=1 Tax=Rosa chinensis TaxID=74649 RepID=A0A2P6RLX9_ROSCH|nr:uncharacterized RNA-binding protein C17H9.04c isoform X1 [Rosa chinensis]PRQ47425.1 putative Zinc finger, RanBP2-type [Rosa chinensis]
MAEGREGDWECGGCRNRNYAFRSYCNRCRQPRLLVDTKTPADSKWLPRIGDWICTGCTNNNYASREKCKKCGQNKELAAMPAIAMPGTSLPAYSNYLGRGQGGLDPKMSFGVMGNGPPQQPFPLNSNWPGVDKYGVQPGSALPVGGIHNAGLPYANPGNEIPKGFRSGDWICSCGFHNYQSRTQCKRCNAFPPALGIKRLASEEFVNDWDNKRLNLGHAIGQQQSYPGFEVVGARGHPIAGPYGHYPGLNSVGAPNLQVPMPLTQHATTPTLFGKGAKQWRNGDWMCTNCDNHNYASRLSCNRCKTERDAAAQPVNVM